MNSNKKKEQKREHKKGKKATFQDGIRYDYNDSSDFKNKK